MQLLYLSGLKFVASREGGIRDFCDAVSRVEADTFDVVQGTVPLYHFPSRSIPSGGTPPAPLPGAAFE